jgi:hypothetical protein
MFKHSLLTPLFFSLCVASPLSAEGLCAETQQVLNMLEKKFSERSFGSGLIKEGEARTEIFINENTKTWTIVVHMPSGISCIVLEGTDWEILIEHLPPNL